MNSSILALATAVPPHYFLQNALSHQLSALFKLNPEQTNQLHKMYGNSAIRKRHTIIDDFYHPKEKWNFWGHNYPELIPGMSARNKRYKEEAPKLAEIATRSALETWGRPCSTITHVISVSCTGAIAPGIEFYLMDRLGLPSTVDRFSINFMGCFGAFKGLSIARAFSQENPNARILLVCTELCSLHLQAEHNSESQMGNCLFADGCAAVIIGSDPQPSESPIWEIVRNHSLGFKNSMDKMSWDAGDHGFSLRLSPTVPVLIGRKIKKFIEDLLQNTVGVEQCDFAIHPGGKSILQAIEKALELHPDQTESSWNILAEYGNMSSATFLFILDQLSRQNQARPWSIGLAFGPGLSTEGILLKNKQKN